MLILNDEADHEQWVSDFQRGGADLQAVWPYLLGIWFGELKAIIVCKD